MKNALLIGFILIFTMSCKKNNIVTQRLQGTWIESVHKADTIEFSSESELFILNRGKEMMNGYMLPKPLSGPYYYKIEKGSISLIWGLSSSSGSAMYYFEFDEKNERIKIGNFFMDIPDKKYEILVFIKLNE
jgi:hypothetical protein